MKRLLIGKIVGAHGIRGDLKILSYAQDTDLLFQKEGVFTSETDGQCVVLKMKSAGKPKQFIARLDGIDDRNAAERITGTPLYIDQDALPELDEGDGYYFKDLEGLRVETPEGKILGTVASVENYGAGDLLDIRTKTGKNFFIPFQEPYLIEVDMDAKRITMQQPEIM